MNTWKQTGHCRRAPLFGLLVERVSRDLPWLDATLAGAAAREAAQPSAAERRASAREKSRAEFRAKIAADRRGRSPSKKDERVEVLAGPIPPLSPARPPVVAPVSPGTTDAEVQDLVAKLRATLARRKDKAPSDDDVVRAATLG